ncbi:TetR/AcrR family transcriptional repressor of nem operon [Inquilinus ginsengisoli]|uniref:TetR/AcrR family transcriptional regulator n=1 Tax=Inquilinus ginsengisoli TaxID=363840 RepID=UPI003D218F6A
MVRYPPAETAEKHQKILEQAARMFRERGFDAVSIGDLMRAADLSHGSFYNHFDSRQELMSECVDYVSARAVGQIIGAAPSAEGRKVFVSQYLSVANRDAPGNGCLMSSLASEIAREPKVRPTMTRYVQAFINTIATHFPWKKKANARREAIRLTSSLVGALLLARAVDNEELSLEILNEVTAQYAD